MSLRDGSRKMSKSEPSDMTRINLTDEADAIAQKIRRATTDPDLLPGPDVLDDTGDLPEETRKGRPEAYNLLGIYAALADLSWRQVLERFAGWGFADFKKELADMAIESLAPIGDEMRRLIADPAYIDSVLHDGAERAAAIAGPVVKEAKDAVGFLQP
jgi:tryptophanyl-tRNA synthetase